MSCRPCRAWAATLGTCHGAAQGKNGFQLSLRGYDPLFDHRALIDDIAGRRFNRAAPERSLMLMKPTGVVPHVGGVLTQPGEPNYELIRRWIAQGVKLDLNAPRVTKIEVTPASTVIPLPGMKQQLTVWATYANGDEARCQRRGVPRKQQHRSRHRGQARHGHRRAPRRDRCPGPLRRQLRRRHAHHHGGPHRLRLARDADVQLHRRPRLRQAEVGQDSAERRLQRQRFHPPALSRSDRPAARAGSGQEVPRATTTPSKAETREAGRRAGRQHRFRRSLDQQLGRSSAGQSQVPRHRRGRGVPQVYPRRPWPTTCRTTTSATSC